MARVLLIAGTWDTEPDAWWRPGSPFREELITRGHTLATDDQGSWTTEVEGIVGSHEAWLIAGYDLAKWRRNHPVDAVIAFSHGGQVAAVALASGVPIETLITVGVPPRTDMAAFYQAASAHVGHWLHVYSPFLTDVWQWAGTLMDGSLRYRRDMPQAHVNEAVWWRRHRGLLDPALWTARGFWDHLPTPPVPRARRRPARG